MFFVISKFQVSILSGTRDMIDPFLRAGSSRLKRTLILRVTPRGRDFMVRGGRKNSRTAIFNFLTFEF